MLAAPLMALTLVTAGLALAPPKANAKVKVDEVSAAVRQVLDGQVEAWNHEDLDAFLKAYWNSPRLVFLSNDTRAEGFDGVRDRYRKRYRDNSKAMGQLAFEDLEIEPLNSDAALVRGRFRLRMPDGSTPTGQFTLILRRFPDGWRIIHDHTSTAAPTPAPEGAPASAPPPAP